MSVQCVESNQSEKYQSNILSLHSGGERIPGHDAFVCCPPSGRNRVKDSLDDFKGATYSDSGKSLTRFLAGGATKVDGLA